jgi:hypothetical protein
MVAFGPVIVRFKILISVRLITVKDKPAIKSHSITPLTFNDLLALPLIMAETLCVTNQRF